MPGVFETGTDLKLGPFTRDNGLVGYWSFDETSGTLYDYSGYNNNGTSYGGVTYGVQGKVGNALSFDGSDDYIDCGSDESLAFGTGNFTIGLWIKANGTSPVSYTHLRAHETPEHLVCRLLLEKKNNHSNE